MKTGTVYTLANPTTGEIRYVGVTVRPLGERLQEHCKAGAKRGTHLRHWLASLGTRPTIEALDTVADARALPQAEMYWITQLKAWGMSLVNGTAGGEDLANLSADARQRAIKNSRATRQARPQEVRSAWGASGRAAYQAMAKVDPSVRDVQRAAVSKAVKQVWADPVRREALMISRAKVQQSESYKETKRLEAKVRGFGKNTSPEVSRVNGSLTARAVFFPAVGVFFESVTELARFLGVDRATVRNRFRNGQPINGLNFQII